MKTFLLFFSMIFLLASCDKEVTGLDAIIKKGMEDNHIAGLSLAVIHSGKVGILKTYGYSDLENERLVDNETPFHVASVSKVLVNACIFKLVEDGQMGLDGDINDYLPFQVVNPHFPQEKITVGQLLKHRSGILDDLNLLAPVWGTTKGDSPIPLRVFLENYLTPGGSMYQPSHFAKGGERHAFSYSNIGYSLLGLMVENMAKTDFESFCQTQIFKPMGMKNTSWFLKNLEEKRVAKSYTYSIFTGQKFSGHNGYPDYPSGQLRTSIADFSRFVQGYLNAQNGQFLLKQSTINIITPPFAAANSGFYTFSMKALNNQLYYGQGGGDIGVSSEVLMDISNRNAIIIFINGEYDLIPLAAKIAKEVF